MRIGLVVDSACDLPAGFFERERVEILPITVRIGDAVQADHRDEAQTLAFLESHIAERGASAETIPYTPEQIRDLFLERLVVDYDYVFCMTITGSRSPIFANAQKASWMILNEYKAPRAASGNNTPFALRVIDTRNLFCAQGILPVEAARMRAAGDQPPFIRARLEQIANQTFGYLVPRDLYYLRNRARAKGDRSVGLLSAALGTTLDIKPILRGLRGETGPVAKIKGFDAAAEKLFDFAARRAEEGLLTPTMTLCYGGHLDEMRALPGYERLRSACADRDVEVFESVMSTTGMVNVGRGALVVAFAAADHAFG